MLVERLLLAIGCHRVEVEIEGVSAIHPDPLDAHMRREERPGAEAAQVFDEELLESGFLDLALIAQPDFHDFASTAARADSALRAELGNATMVIVVLNLSGILPDASQLVPPAAQRSSNIV